MPVERSERSDDRRAAHEIPDAPAVIAHGFESSGRSKAAPAGGQGRRIRTGPRAQPAINVVAEYKRWAVSDRAADGRKRGFRIYRAGWIVRAVEHERLCPRRDGGAERFICQLKARPGGVQIHGNSACEACHGLVKPKGGRRDHDLVAGVEDAGQRAVNGFRCTGGDNDLVRV